MQFVHVPLALSPEISLPLRMGGKPATLKVITLKVPDVWAKAGVMAEIAGTRYWK